MRTFQDSWCCSCPQVCVWSFGAAWYHGFADKLRHAVCSVMHGGPMTHFELSIACSLQVQHLAPVLLRGSCMSLLLGGLGPQPGHERCLCLIGLAQLVQPPQLSDLMQMRCCQQLLKAPAACKLLASLHWHHCTGITGTFLWCREHSTEAKGCAKCADCCLSCGVDSSR